MRETIKDYSGRIIGFMESQSNGDIIVKDAYGKILGRYDAATNTTKDVHGRILFKGNMAGSLIGMYGNQ